MWGNKTNDTTCKETNDSLKVPQFYHIGLNRMGSPASPVDDAFEPHRAKA